MDKVLCFVFVLWVLGVDLGDKVVLILKNCVEWFICDLVMMFGDYISVLIFLIVGSEIIDYCFEYSESKILIVGKLDDNKVIVYVLVECFNFISILFFYFLVVKC